jgi:APA family basic amino acid/polyamine antiporter
MAQQLRRELGVFGATMLGLGSIIGTGIFVSVGIGAGVAGPAVIIAIALAAFVATCNGLNSAQLAASHPVSGGTYEYGYTYLNPHLGFTAGWMFLLAKSASAATAALGFAGYVLNALDIAESSLLVPLALITVVVMTAIVLSGIRRSNRANTLIVSVTLLALGVFIIVGVPSINAEHFSPFLPETAGLSGLLQAAALMFVAYTGYGRIATMGEEVAEPRRSIPRAIIATLVVTMLLYMAVAVVSVGVISAPSLAGAAGSEAAPLVVASQAFGLPAVPQLIALGAITAMLGVLLNLILGLSRMLLAMGRRRDMPALTARLNTDGTTPSIAVIVIGAVIAGLVLIGSVRLTWSFSAFTVLIYYAITNLAALQLRADTRLFPRFIAWAGLAACLFLAFWVDMPVWLAGLGLIAVGLIWQMVMQRVQTA